jgi:hypothetical protein
VAIGFAVWGVGCWYWPGFNGIFFAADEVSLGDNRIIAAIFIVGAGILWFIRPPPKDS